MLNKKISVLLIVISILIIGVNNTGGVSIESNKSFFPDNDKFTVLDFDPELLPSSFSWRDKDGVDFITPIRAQQPFHSCETFAFTAAVEAMVQIKVGYPFGCDLSEAHVYFNCDGNLDWGSHPEKDLDYLVEFGIPDEACFPYPKEHKIFPKNSSCEGWENRTVKVTKWSYLPSNDINQIKNALVTNGPVPVYFHVYDDFKSYKRGVYIHRWGELIAAHLVCIVGYVDDPSINSGGYWIVKNSWGDKWGDNGWFNIAYGECSMELMPVYFEDVTGTFPILYVDDDNTEGPWDGSLNHPYKTIPEAIEKAYDSWTVFVKEGTYHGNIIIDKSINLDGEKNTSTILIGDGIDNVIYIKKPNVRVSGFTIQNSGSNFFDAGIQTLSLNSNATIKNNILKNNDVGIHLNYAYEQSGNTVSNNIIENNRIGIFSLWSFNNLIEENKIMSNSEKGILIEASQSGSVKKNLLLNNGGYGIELIGASDKYDIRSNDIVNHEIGLKLDHTNKVKIIRNNFIGNQKQATFKESYLNLWIRNYWDDWERIIPKPIKGTVLNLDIPSLDFDLLPSKNQH